MWIQCKFLSFYVFCSLISLSQCHQWVMVRKEKQGCCRQKKKNNSLVHVIDLREHTQRSNASTLKNSLSFRVCPRENKLCVLCLLEGGGEFVKCVCKCVCVCVWCEKKGHCEWLQTLWLMPFMFCLKYGRVNRSQFWTVKKKNGKDFVGDN